MRHRVATFFRPNVNTVPVNENTKISNSLTCMSSSSHHLNSLFHYNFGSEEKTPKSHDSHRWICPLTSCHKAAPAISSLDVEIESPPLVFYGPTTTSSGALLSGQLVLRVLHELNTIESFKMILGVDVIRKKPFHAHCSECGTQRNELETWNFLHGPATLPKGLHKFPFSWILPGHLPASAKGALFQIEYSLRATLNLKDGAEPITLSKTLNVKRAIIPLEIPRNSIRIFPPTNLTAHCELPSLIHPIGSFSVSLRIDGCVKKSGNTQHHWKLKRLHWHLEEIQKTISPGCPKHLAKRPVKDEESEKVEHTDVHVIGEGYFRAGWKTDYSTPDGRIDMEFPITINPGARPTCDMKTEDGNEVSHSLIVEMIVIEGLATLRNPNEDTLTGAARFLRMNFDMTVTERSGLGISWDEEQPPMYENVPNGPPSYENVVSCEAEPLPDYECLTRIDAIRVSPTPANNLECVPHSRSNSNTPYAAIQKIWMRPLIITQ